jgi:SsrA-binding protein
MKKESNSSKKIVISNRQARRNYEVLEKIEAGISLLGPEVKSLRDGKGQIADAYVKIVKMEAFITNMHINPYEFVNINSPAPIRDRKLLLHKREIDKLFSRIREKGLAIIPLSLYLKRGKFKVELGICKGKKLHDKRESIKKRDSQREMDRALKKG